MIRLPSIIGCLIIFCTYSFSDNLVKPPKDLENFPTIRSSIGHVANAISVLTPTDGQTATGTMRFFQTPNGVNISGVFTGLAPNSSYAIAVYELGDLSDVSKKSYGKRYNPERINHALPPNQHRPPGTFGNINTNQAGEALFELFDQTITLSGIKYPILGRSVAIHSSADEPTVSSGGQIIAIGIIGLTK